MLAPFQHLSASRSGRLLGALFGTLLGILLLTSGATDEKVRKLQLKDRVSDEELKEVPAAEDPGVLRFGFDLRSSPQEDARQYVPFLKYLEKVTGSRIELYFASKKNSIVDDLGSGLVQFAAVGSISFILADEKYGVIPLVRGLNSEGKAEYQSLIIVRPDSPLMKVEDLVGKRFAFGSYTSTQGHVIPRIMLSEHGITLAKLSAYEFTGSHYNCASAVIAGRFDAGGIQDTMGKELAKAGQVRILDTSRYYPSSGIAANKHVSPEIIAKIKKALLDFQPRGRDAGGLYHWDKTEMANGFTEARQADYDELRQWVRKFGLLGPNPLGTPHAP